MGVFIDGPAFTLRVTTCVTSELLNENTVPGPSDAGSPSASIIANMAGAILCPSRGAFSASTEKKTNILDCMRTA